MNIIRDILIKFSQINLKLFGNLFKKNEKCKSEMCWLNRLASSNAQVRLKEILFSPEKPKSWNKDPNTWLTNFDIENVLNQYEESHKNFDFIGPSFIDLILKLEILVSIQRFVILI